MTNMVLLAGAWEMRVAYTGPHGFIQDEAIERRNKAVQAQNAPEKATEFYYYDRLVAQVGSGARDFRVESEEIDRSVAYVINGMKFNREGLKDLMERLKGNVPDTEGLLKYWGDGPAPVYTAFERDSQLIGDALKKGYDQVVRDRRGFFRKYSSKLYGLAPTS